VRPVNLIPPEDRRGDHAPLRAGSLSYVIVGGIAAVLVAVVALVLTQNSITDRENEIAQLEVARDAATQRAQALAPYAEFASLQEQRELTISSLAQSRFDWERVLRELAIIIPADITLNNLEATTSGQAEGGTESAAGVGTAPSMVMAGCAPSHDAVAAFVAALKDIDGVTRVGLDNSTKAGDAEGSGSAAAESGEGCTGPDKRTSFGLTAVFDGVAVPADAAAAPAAPVAAPAEAPAAPEAPAAETNSAQEQVQEAEEATNLVPGTAR
jgi:Tfp pilus assembly protein PilN